MDEKSKPFAQDPTSFETYEMWLNGSNPYILPENRVLAGKGIWAQLQDTEQAKAVYRGPGSLTKTEMEKALHDMFMQTGQNTSLLEIFRMYWMDKSEPPPPVKRQAWVLLENNQKELVWLQDNKAADLLGNEVPYVTIERYCDE